MLKSIASGLLGSSNDRLLKQYHKKVKVINALEVDVANDDDGALRQRFEKLRQKAEDGESLDSLMPFVFACVREAAKRALGQRPYDAQLIGGMILHDGRIAEMATGEGKTLTSTMPVALNALTGKGVHVVTVNDYLASRDAKWMGRVYDFLGLTVGAITEDMGDNERKAAYDADITYGTNNQFGFDYLRDNLKPDARLMVQRDFNFAIVDEVDSILIDEARTPLIISGPADDSGHYYAAVNRLIPQLEPDDYEMDEKMKTVNLTEHGQEKIESILYQENLLEGENLYDVQNISIVHHINQALRAHMLFERDRDYIVKDNKVVIIDEFTGRMMEGRRYSDGLHQALEAKENVTIQKENQTLASITFQNYFRMYPKLAGMTGTAMTEASEFEEIYGLQTAAVPTHREMVRRDFDDEIYRTFDEKMTAVEILIEDCQKRQQPVLVGTTSIEKSEALSARLKKKKIKHSVLNARKHKQEAEIVENAGRPGAVTIATNMAGRGTDIQLGGNLQAMIDEAAGGETDPEKIKPIAEKIKAEHDEAQHLVLKAGGLYIIGTERHESRRIDNQLRGRAGRQGDPGRSQFFLSLEDDLMRIFGSERLDGMLKRIGMPEGEPIRHPWISKALERAQRKVEQMHFEGRKELLKYDNVMNDQRKVIYEQRKEVMFAEEISELVTDMRHESIERLVRRHIPPGSYPENWTTESLQEDVRRVLGLDTPVTEWAEEEGIADEEVTERLLTASDERMAARVKEMGVETMRALEKQIFLYSIDHIWKDHLLMLDHLRQGIRLRAFGQRDPLNEFKAEAFELFQEMLDRLQDQVTQALSIMQVSAAPSTEEAIPYRRPMSEGVEMTRGDASDFSLSADPQQSAAAPTEPDPDQPRTTRQAATAIDPNDPSTWGRVPRNALCPCGSGKKYKQCHGKVQSVANG